MEMEVKNKVNGVLPIFNKWEMYENVCVLLNEAERINVNVNAVDTFLSSENKNIIYTLGLKVQLLDSFCEDVIERLDLMSQVTWPNRNLAKVIITDLVNKMLLKGINKNNCFVKCIFNHRKAIMTLYQERLALQNTDRLYYCMINTLISSYAEVVSCLENNDFKLVPTPSTYQEFLSKTSTMERNEFIMDFHFSELFVFKVNPFNNLKYDIGKIKRSLLNEVFLVSLKASLAVAKILDPPRNSTIVDLCACPGTKTFCLAATVKNEGKIFAVDMDEKKITMLKKMLKRTGVTCVDSVTEEVFSQNMPFKMELIDCIVLDAPCFRPSYKLIDQKNDLLNDLAAARKMNNLFVKMLHDIFKRYVNVKKIVYTTCSRNVEENEGVVEAVLPFVEPFGFDLVDCHTLLPGFSAGSRLFTVGPKCLYLTAERDNTDCFIALFAKETDPSWPCNNGPVIKPKKVLNSTVNELDTQTNEMDVDHIKNPESVNRNEIVSSTNKVSDQCIITFSIKRRGKKVKKRTPLKLKSQKAMKNLIRRKIIGNKRLKQ